MDRGRDKGYDTNDFVADMREMNTTPHVAQNTERKGGSAIDGRTTRHAGYLVSQRIRKRIEEAFGWIKTVGNLRKTGTVAWPRSIGTSPACQPTTWSVCATWGLPPHNWQSVRKTRPIG